MSVIIVVMVVAAAAPTASTPSTLNDDHVLWPCGLTSPRQPDWNLMRIKRYRSPSRVIGSRITCPV